MHTAYLAWASIHLAILSVARWPQDGWGARSLTCVGVTGAMLITGAGDTADIGTPQRCLPLVSWSTRFTELAHVSLGA